MNQPSPSCERESVDTVGELIVAVADYDPNTPVSGGIVAAEVYDATSTQQFPAGWYLLRSGGVCP